MSKILPWVLVVALLAGGGVLYSAHRKQTASLDQLRQERDQLTAAVEDATKVKADNETSELVRLRKENEDLLRLRNEVRQLRDEKTQLTKQLQAAQNQVQTSLAQAQRTNPAAPNPAPTNPAAAVQQAAADAEALRNRYGLPPGAATDPVSICTHNLRVIDAAKQQWALEKAKPLNTLVAGPDISPYLKDKTMPTCPAGGAYSINPVGVTPTCSSPGHALPK
jgi:hypothetical protein